MPKSDDPLKENDSKLPRMFISSGLPYSSTPSKLSEESCCRIFDLFLVWNATAAHRSQFVCYRRLSVMFSRYTYINDLVELSIADNGNVNDAYGDEKDDDDDENDDDVLQLPPVSTIDETDDTPPNFLLTHKQMTVLRNAALPISLHHRPWKRIYSLSRDGDSFVSFRRLVGDWNARREGHATILVVRTFGGEVAGGYADVPWVEMKSVPSGGTGGRSCLFRVRRRDANTNNDDDDDDDEGVQIFGKDPSSGNPIQIVCDPTRRIVAFGGGDGDDGFALCLEDGFVRGTCAKCRALGGERLVDGDKRDGDGGGRGDVFEVSDVEVWGFVSGVF